MKIYLKLKKSKISFCNFILGCMESKTDTQKRNVWKRENGFVYIFCKSYRKPIYMMKH